MTYLPWKLLYGKQKPSYPTKWNNYSMKHLLAWNCEDIRSVLPSLATYHRIKIMTIISFSLNNLEALYLKSLMAPTYQYSLTSPGWCGLVGWVLSHKSKGCRFNPQSGRITRLQVWSQPHHSSSPCLSFFLPSPHSKNK